jgi:SAM-dependent methyltransferase
MHSRTPDASTSTQRTSPHTTNKSPTDWSNEIAVLRALGIDATSTVVDRAGTGTFAKAIAPHVARVVAVDVSEPMVAEMGARGVEAVHAGFLSYEHQGRLPDAVFTRNALHHLPDLWKAIALERVARLLQPGGVLPLSTPPSPDCSSRYSSALASRSAIDG